MLELEFTPRCSCCAHKKTASLPLLAVSDAQTAVIHIYDGRGERKEPIHTLKGLHRSAVALMAFNDTYDCVVSADEGGMLEYWRPDGNYEKPDNVFALKSATTLFEFTPAKAVPVS